MDFFPNFENGDPKTLSGFVKGTQLSIEVAPHRPALSAMFFPLLMVPLLRLCFLLPKVNITEGHFSKISFGITHPAAASMGLTVWKCSASQSGPRLLLWDPPDCQRSL